MSSFDPTGTLYKILPEVYRVEAEALECLQDATYTKRAQRILGIDTAEMDRDELLGRVTARIAYVTSQAMVHEWQRIEREAEAVVKVKRTGKAAERNAA